jgi:thymidylate synthase ThyX
MNERIKKLVARADMYANEQNELYGVSYSQTFNEKFAELIVRECNQAVSEVPLFYQDYRSQIEAAVIRDCARAVLERFGVEE